MRIKKAPHVGEILGALGNMGSYKSRPRMPGEHEFTLIEQFFLGIFRAVKAPIRMSREFFIALVETVDRHEECIRVGRVKHHRNAKLSGLFEKRSQPLIVHTKKLSIGTAERQPQVLP